MQDRRRRFRLTIMLLTITTLACRLGLTPFPTPQATSQNPPGDPATSTPYPDTPTPTTIPNPCPVQQSLPIPEKQPLTLYPETIKEYLTQGGRPEEILLTDWEAYLKVDLTGDQIAEDVFIFIDPTSEIFPPESALVIYHCSNGTINILQFYQPEDWWGLEIIGAGDLTQDNHVDFIFAEVSCGASTCWHTLHVWSWTGSGFVDNVGADLSFPFPDYQLENEQLLVTSAGVGSVGAGPQRITSTTVEWNGTVVTATHSRFYQQFRLRKSFLRS